MKKKRLLALVLCFVMLFSDATSTFASSLSDTPVVITETSGENEEVGSELTETETTGTEVAESESLGEEETDTSEIPEGTEAPAEGTEEVVPEEQTTETTETTEVSETEAVEEAEVPEIEVEIVEEVEQVKASANALVVGYNDTNTGTWVDVGTYASFADALSDIETYIANNVLASNTSIQISMQEDVDITGTDIVLSSNNVRLMVGLMGHTLTTSQDTVIQADVVSDPSNLGTIQVNNGATLTILPVEPAVVENGSDFTNWQNVNIEFDSTNPGNLIAGTKTNSSGDLSQNHLRLNDVLIGYVRNLTVEGNVGIDAINRSLADIPLEVAETMLVTTERPNDGEISQSVEILVPTTCSRLVWNARGDLGDFTATDLVGLGIESRLDILGDVSLKDVDIECAGYEDESLWINIAEKFDGTTSQSIGSLTIDGSISVIGELICKPIMVGKVDIMADGRPEQGTFEHGDVIATFDSNASVDASIWGIADNGAMCVVQKDNTLVVENKVVEIFLWNQEQGYTEKAVSYGSWDDAMAGLRNDFGGKEAQYNIHVYDDVTFTQDVVIPEFVTELYLEPKWNMVEDSNGNWTEQIQFATMDLNGYSMSAPCDIFWNEGIMLKNSSSNESRIQLTAEAVEWTENTEGHEPVFRVNWAESGYDWVDSDGNPIDKTQEFTWNSGVTIDVLHGRLELDSDSIERERKIDADVKATRVAAFKGIWTLGNVTIYEGNDVSVVNKDAKVIITGTTTVPGDRGFFVRGDLQFGNIVVNPNSQDAGRDVMIQIFSLYDRDNQNAYLGIGSVTFNGTITNNTPNASPIRFGRGETYYYQEPGMDWVNEESNHWLPFAGGDKVATVVKTEAEVPTSLFNASSDGTSYVVKRSGNTLEVYKAAVSVECWNEETQTGLNRAYTSLEDAFDNMASDFGNARGRYNVVINDDVTLTKDIVLPDCVTELGIWTGSQWIQIGNEEVEAMTFVTMDFNGHSLTVNGDIFISEAVSLTNSAKATSKINITAEAIEWTPESEGYTPALRVNGIRPDMLCVDAEGNTIDRTGEYIWNNDVVIEVPNGRLELGVDEAECVRVINADIIAGTLGVHNGSWKLGNVTVFARNDGTFISENATVVLTGTTNVPAGGHFHVRGDVTFGRVVVNVDMNDPYANFCVMVVTGYEGNPWDDVADENTYQGKVTFAGPIVTTGSMSTAPVGIDKAVVYRWVATDEFGNIIWENEEEQIPWYDEHQEGNQPFVSGETVATIKDKSLVSAMFNANGSDAVLKVEGEALKAYKAAVRVDVWWEEESAGAERRYSTLEDAFANMEADFGGKPGHYTFSILENVQMSGNLTVPSFVTSMRMQADMRWCEHYDEETGEPIFIYDEEGNVVGTEGHEESDFATFDLNGFTLTSAASIEFMEGLSVVSTADTKGKVVVTATSNEENWAVVSFNQLANGGLILEDGTWVERNENYQWAFVENVDIVAENGAVQLWSNWANYTINGDITANEMNVRGNWNVENVTVTTDLCIETGWYDPETDTGEPEGFLTVENLTVGGGHVYNGGRIFVNDTFTVTDAGIIDNQALIIADTFAMETGRFDNWGQVDVKNATIQDFYAHTHIDFNEDGTEIIGQRGSIFICDTLTQPANGHSWFDRGTTFVVNEKAVFYNPMIGGWNWDAWDEVNIHRMPNATIEMNGEITCDVGDAHASMSILDPVANAVRFSFAEHFDRDEEGNVVGNWYDVAYVDENGEIIQNVQDIWAAKVLAKNEVLFTTDAKEFPTDLIWLHQTGENAQYWSVYQKGNELLVGGNWIHIYAQAGDNGVGLGEFSLWSEAEKFIAELANPDLSYVIEINDDLEIEGKLTFPAKAKDVAYIGAKPDGSQVVLTYTGDITLDTNVTFERIKFNAVNADGEEYHSVVNIKDNVLAFFDVNADFASITGTKGSGLVVVGGGIEGQKITVDGALKNVDIIDMGVGQLVVGVKLDADDAAITGVKDVYLHESVLEAKNGSITITGETALIGATIKAASKITLGDVYSTNNRNQIVYAGNDAANILTITGSVYGPGDFGMSEELLVFEGFDGVTADNRIVNYEDETRVESIRRAAIDITVESLVTKGYAQGDVLLIAPKVSAKWFVVGSEYNGNGDRTAIASMTHQDGDNICYGVAAEKPVYLYTWNDADGSYLGYNSYSTLQDAFNAIEKIGDEYGDYQITLSEDMDAATAPAVLKTPVKAGFIMISSENAAVKLYYQNELQINSNVILSNVILAPQSASSKITLGSNTLYLQSGTSVAAGSKIASVTGSGFGKGSAFGVFDAAFTVAGNVDKVDTILLKDAELIVQGKANIGDIIAYDTTDAQGTINPTLTGTAVVTRTNGKVTKLVPQITINGETDYTASPVTISLYEAGTENEIDFLAADMADMLAKGIQLAKAPKLASAMVLISNKNIKDVNQLSQYMATKANGYLVPQLISNVGATVSYTKAYDIWNDEIGDYEPTDVLITSAVKTFADAVTEINNLKTKQEYAILLTPAAAAISLSAPTALKMPNKNAVESLIISSSGETPVDLHYTGNITFTSDVLLMNVDFVQVTKVSGGYFPYDVNTYASPVTVSAGGYDMIVTNVTFNTPVKMDGKKGNLAVMGTLRTVTNGYDDLFCGSITNFKEVYILSDLAFYEYWAGGKFVAPTFSATTVTIDSGSVVDLYSYDVAAKVSITDLVVYNGELYSQGPITVTNAELYGAAWVGTNGKMTFTNVDLFDNAMMLGVSDFVISGTVTSHTPNAVLASAQKSATNLTPGLNITGKVVLEDPSYKIGIMVTDPTGQGAVTITGLPNTYGQMLTAKNATADLFKAAVLGSGEEAVDNVNGKPAYSDVNQDGYVFVKNGTAIYAYNGNEIAVEVIKDGEIFGYYTSLNDASKAITAENDKEAIYEVVLLKDVNSADAPAALTLPGNAANVIIISKAGEDAKNLYFTGKLSLKAPTAFANVVFQPMTKSKEGTAFDIETGVHYMALSDVAVGNMEGMALRNIKGNAKQNTAISSDGLVVTGSITNTSGLLIDANTTVKGNIKVNQLAMVSNLTVDGSVTVNELLTQGNVTLDAQKNAVTIKDIDVYSGQPTIIYGKNAKGAGNLTIKGKVESENPIILNHVFTDMVEDDFRVIFENRSVQLTLRENQKIASIEKAPLSDFKVLFNGNEIALVNRLAKANKYVYLFSMEQIVSSSCVQLEMTKGGKTSTTYFIDFTQAVNEINLLNDIEADYVIHTGIRFGGLEDTNQLDKKNFGPLTLPKANTANSLTIVSDNQSEIYFSGNISYSGNLTLKDVTLVPMKDVRNFVDANITVTKDKRGVAELNLVNVSTYADGSWSNGKAEMTGFIGQISGTKNVTNVTLTNCDLRIKKGISNVDTLTLENAQLITCGAATVNNVVITDDLNVTASTWDALGKTTVGDITVGNWDRTVGYIAAKQDKKQVPTFTVTGDVNIVDGNGAVPVNVIPASAPVTNINHLYIDQVANVGLVVAKAAGADKFIARPYRGMANILSYKDSKNIVKNGNADEMKVLLSYEGGETYAKSYAEAVTLINNIGDKNGVYTIQFLTAGDVTVNGTSYGALTFPTKAKEVFITGQVDPDNNNAPTTVLKYTGTMKPGVSVTFADIILTEGKVDKDEFVPSYAVTPTVSKADVIIGFEAGATTLKKAGASEAVDLVFTSISGNKGGVAVFDQNVEVQKDASLATLYVTDNATVDVLGKLTVKAINVVNISPESRMATVSADNAMTITDINGINSDGNDSLLLGTRYTAKEADESVSQLTVNGEINDIIVGIATELYDFETQTYHMMAAEEAEALLIVDENVSPAKNQKIATMPKASVMDLTIFVGSENDIQPYAMTEMSEEYASIVKYNGGVYITKLPPLLAVAGFGPTYEGEEIVGWGMTYVSNFLDWDEAVKEIDKIGNKEVVYEMHLLRNVGQKLNGELAPIKNLKLPTKAIFVGIYGENIFFTGKINIKTDMEFIDTGLMAVKQVKQGKNSWYESTKYDVAIGNNYVLMQDMHSDVEIYNEYGEAIGWYENLPGTISGSKKGYFEFGRAFEGDYNYSNMPATKITGIGNVAFYCGEAGEGYEDYYTFMTVPMGMSGVDNLIVNPRVYLESWDGAMNVKNLESTNSFVRAKNLTVTGTTELTSGILVAGTDVVGDGTLKLANVVLHDDNSILSAKQDKKGKSLMQITGTVTASEAFYEELGEEASTEGALTVDIRYNNDVSCAQLYNGFMLLTAPKADASWFVPFYTHTEPRQAVDEEGNPIFDEETGEPVFIPILDENDEPVINEETGEIEYEQEYFPGMGWYNPDYCVYKLGKAIYYGYGAQ